MINMDYFKRVVVINGSGGVGKDTAVKHITDMIYSIDSKLLVCNYSSVDKVKKIAELIGWDGTKTERNRKFLSDLKMLTSEYNDMPFNDMKRRFEEFQDVDNEILLFLHIREPEEIERVKREFGAITILIKRDSIPQITSNMADGNVFNYDYDIVIDNNDSECKLKYVCYDLGYDLIFKEQLKKYYDCAEFK